MSLTENIDKAIKDIEIKFEGGLSNTSTKKFNYLSVAISEIVGIPKEDIYITSVVARSSNTWNRLSQGKPLSRHYTLGVCIAARDGVNGVLAPLVRFIGSDIAHYDSIAVIAQDDDEIWKIKAIATNAKDLVSVKCQNQYEDAIIKLVNVVSNPIQEVVERSINPQDAMINNVANVTVPQNIKKSRQLIIYGAPGTGKSHKIMEETKNAKVFRTTFHPDSDYASFVGAYKPIMKLIKRTALVGKKLEMADVESVEDELKKEKVISYEFVEQVFTRAYIQAWAYQKIAKDGETPKCVYLVIEEINRGNCAQVFGDLFQLLDRNENGFSEYAIVPDSDFGRHIGESLGKVEGTFDEVRKASINKHYPYAEEGVNVVDEVMEGRLMLLPDNLFIRATMNTSDQSLFPMDSAFKRRWDWDYVAIKDHPKKNWEIEIDAATHYRWWDFLVAINKEIFKATSSEDKQLGYFFVRAHNDKLIDLNMFVNKVIFYLWNSVFKDCYTDCEFMKLGTDDYFTFTSFFKDGKPDADRAKAFLEKLGITPKRDEPPSEENAMNHDTASGEVNDAENQETTETNA